jgi:mannose-6-phosphate isomerase-like protein (cupin superfamily)
MVCDWSLNLHNYLFCKLCPIRGTSLYFSCTLNYNIFLLFYFVYCDPLTFCVCYVLLEMSSNAEVLMLVTNLTTASYRQQTEWFLAMFWESTCHVPTTMPISAHKKRPYKTKSIKGFDNRKFQVVELDAKILPQPTRDIATAQLLEVNEDQATEILSKISSYDDDEFGATDESLQVAAIERAFDEHEDHQVKFQSKDHRRQQSLSIAERSSSNSSFPAPTPPLPPRPTKKVQSIADHKAFVDVGIHEDSRLYMGDPWMIHIGYKIQMAVIALNPHEQLGMEQHYQGVQLIYVLDGDLVVHVREPQSQHQMEDFTDVFYRCGAGQLVVIPRGTAHNVLNQTDNEPARAWVFYAPLVHSDDMGVYAEKYNDRTVPTDFHMDYSITPEGRGTQEFTQLFDALLEALNTEVDKLICGSDDYEVWTHVVRNNVGRVLSREGYYYVLAGQGDLYNGGSSRNLRTAPDTLRLIPGAIFYIAPESYATLSTHDAGGALHLLAFVHPEPTPEFNVMSSIAQLSLPEENSVELMTAAEQEQYVSYVAPTLFVPEVVNAAPITAGDIQQVNLLDVIRNAMDARRSVFKPEFQYSDNDDDQEQSGEDQDWDDEY